MFAVSLGGRDQLLAAHLAERTGRSGPLLAVGVLASAMSAAAMAAAGLALALVLPEPASDMLVAIALAVAAVELAWPVKAALPAEPTHSLFAALIVLTARQVGDAARFLVFAFAAGGSAWMAGIGGMLGGAAALALGVALGGELGHWPLRPIRLALAAITVLVAVVIALTVRGIVG